MEQVADSLQKLTTTDAVQDAAYTHVSSSRRTRHCLQDLPDELQGLILSKAPTLKSLSALVHASPNLHRVYFVDRLRILRSVLGNTVSGMVPDAIGAYQSGTDHYQETRETSLLWQFIKGYEDSQATAESDLIAQLSFEDVIHLFHFHILVIEPLTEKYASWVLPQLPTSVEKHTEQNPLSDVERRRIQRAMYRLQIFCNVCGSTGEGRRSVIRIQDNADRLRILSIFPAWEIEQILCFHQFIMGIYDDVFKRVAWDLNMAKNPRYRHLDMTATLDDLMHLEHAAHGGLNTRALTGVFRHGLPLLLDTIRTEDHEQLVERIRAAILSGLGHEHRDYVSGEWIHEAIEYCVQQERRERWYSQHDFAQESRHKMPFEGDRLDCPPNAWVLHWRGEYSNIIDPYTAKEMRRWGYVMWDAARLGPCEEAQIEYYSSMLLGRGEDEDPRWETWDPSVRLETGSEGKVINFSPDIDAHGDF